MTFSYLREFAGVYLTIVVYIKAHEHHINQLLPGSHVVLVGTVDVRTHISLVMQIQNLAFQPMVVTQPAAVVWEK